jgi:hypothetical protein
MSNIDYNKRVEGSLKLRLIYKEFCNIIKNSLDEFNAAKAPPYTKVINQNLLQRLYYGVNSIDHLFDKFNQDLNYKFSIAILMRTCLLDSITIAYLSLPDIIGDICEFNKQVARLSYIVAKEVNKNIQDEIQTYGLDEKQIRDRYKLASQFLPYNFTDEDTPTIRNDVRQISPKNMADKLENTVLDRYTDAYSFYRYYSKYEHFGSLGKFMLDFDAEYEFDKLKLSSIFVFESTIISLKVIESSNSSIQGIIHLRDQILNIQPLFKSNL